jgi:hypothetical protein
MADDKKIIRDEIYNAAPSTAYIDKKGKYVPCETNQPLAIQTEQGLTGAREIAPHKHPTQVSGYCEHGQLGGCPKDAE